MLYNIIPRLIESERAACAYQDAQVFAVI